MIANCYDLNKRGTVIISAGRAGSHLLGDIITSNVQSSENLQEYFFNITPTTKDFYRLRDKLKKSGRYQVIQIQDFTNLTRIINFDDNWLEQFHVVRLTRTDLVKQLFGLQVLYNYHQIVPTHTIDGINDTFEPLRGKSLELTRDDVYQFLAHRKLLDLIHSDVDVVYEDLVRWEEVPQSKYKKNNYPINPEEMIRNYSQVSDWLYGND